MKYLDYEGLKFFLQRLKGILNSSLDDVRSLIQNKADTDHYHTTASIIDLDVYSKDDLRGTFLTKSDANELFAEKKDYPTRTEVFNLINDYIKWEDKKITLYYSGTDSIRLFNQNILDEIEYIEIDGIEVNKSSLIINDNITLTSVGNVSKGGQSVVLFNFSNDSEHRVDIKYNSNTLPSFALCQLDKLIKIELSAKISSIQNDSITNLVNLREIYLSDNIITLGERNITGSQLLTSIIFPDRIQRISNGVLSSCPNIAAIKFGKSITTFDAWALGDLTNLKAIYFYADEINIIDGDRHENVFWGAGKNVPTSEKAIHYEGSNNVIPQDILDNAWFKGGRLYNETITPWQIFNKEIQVR